MTRLFTSFDIKIFRRRILFFCLFVFLGFNLNSYSNIITQNFILLKYEIIRFFYSLKPLYFSKRFSFFLLTLIVSILALNFLSVWPFIFASTSQMSIVLFMSLTAWLGIIFFSLKNGVRFFIAHSIPEGTPIYLTWFLFLIEIISNSIRPVTLTVRLVANILAGHLLIILLSELVLKIYFVFPIYLGLNLVELFVSIIQSYIFCTIICLYFSEIH